MKKCFLLLAIFFTCSFANFIVASEAGVEKPVEKPGEYKEPTNEQEAVEEWHKVDDQEQYAEETVKEKEKKWKDALKEMNQAEWNSKAFNEANKRYEEGLKEWTAANKAKDEWTKRKDELSQNELVKKYTERLANIYERPTQPFKEPSFWTKLRKGVEAWFKNRQIDYYKWINNPEKVKEAKLNLSQIYTSLGKDGLLNRARINKELLADIEELDKKIGKSLSILEDYYEGAVSKEEIKGEVKELIIDLGILKEELKEEGFDQKIRDIIDEKVEKTFEDFNITSEEQEELNKQLEKKLEKPEETKKEVPEAPPAPTERKEIKKLTLDVSNMTDGRAWAKAIFSDPLNYAENPSFKDFVTQLDVLSRVDVAKLPANERVLLRETVSNGYRNLYDTLSMHSVDIGLTPEARMVSLVRFIELSNKFSEVREKFNQEFETFSEANAREATPEEMKNEKGDVTKPLSKGFTDNFTQTFDKAKYMEKIMDRINAGDSEGISKNYNEFDSAMTAWKERIDQAAVNQESLDVREKMLEVYADLMRKINELSRQKDISSSQVARILVDIQIKDAALGRELEADRSALVILQEKGPKLVGELLKERARLSDETLLTEQDKVRQQAAAEQELFKQNWEQLSADDQKKVFLREIKMGVKLRSTEPMEKSKNVDQLIDQLALQVKEKQADLSPDIQEKLRSAKTETQLKNAVAELTYAAAREALKPTKTKEAMAPKDWWDEYVATGAEAKEKTIVPPGGDASGVPE